MEYGEQSLFYASTYLLQYEISISRQNDIIIRVTPRPQDAPLNKREKEIAKLVVKIDPALDSFSKSDKGWKHIIRNPESIEEAINTVEKHIEEVMRAHGKGHAVSKTTPTCHVDYKASRPIRESARNRHCRNTTPSCREPNR